MKEYEPKTAEETGRAGKDDSKRWKLTKVNVNNPDPLERLFKKSLKKKVVEIGELRAVCKLEH